MGQSGSLWTAEGKPAASAESCLIKKYLGIQQAFLGRPLVKLYVSLLSIFFLISQFSADRGRGGSDGNKFS